MIGQILPLRPLTPAERHGFLIALGVLSTWGRQIAAQSAMTGGLPQLMSPVRQMKDRGEFVVDLCRAMELTIGAAPTAEPSEAVQGDLFALSATQQARPDGAGPDKDLTDGHLVLGLCDRVRRDGDGPALGASPARAVARPPQGQGVL